MSGAAWWHTLYNLFIQSASSVYKESKMLAKTHTWCFKWDMACSTVSRNSHQTVCNNSEFVVHCCSTAKCCLFMYVCICLFVYMFVYFYLLDFLNNNGSRIVWAMLFAWLCVCAPDEGGEERWKGEGRKGMELRNEGFLSDPFLVVLRYIYGKHMSAYSQWAVIVLGKLRNCLVLIIQPEEGVIS